MCSDKCFKKLKKKEEKNTLKNKKMLNSANMYPWYRDSMSQLGQFCSGNNLPAATAAHIKTENGYSDCMLALDYAQNKVRCLNYFINNIGPGWIMYK